MPVQKENNYYAYNRTQESFAATDVKVADGYFSRLVGLLGKTKRWARDGRGLWIVPSKGVHTLGMLFPIDVVFLDKNQVVVHVEEHLRPFRISKVSLKASSVLELPAHTIFRSGTRVGDQFDIKPVPQFQSSPKIKQEKAESAKPKTNQQQTEGNQSEDRAVSVASRDVLTSFRSEVVRRLVERGAAGSE
ncbi:MAG TPA: DUF192 domain-containing protein [Terriglobales bacterium]|nr:DUF192 domain-containing protein [Terriglobales bacterium]